MRAVILNPGPSMPTETPTADLLIGTNRAATGHKVDVWCCCDLPAIESWHGAVIGSPLLVAGQEAIDNLRDRKVIWRGETFDRREMLAFCKLEFQWVMFSATTALIYAAFRGANAIDIYGSDLSGTADWDGVQAGKNRTDERWKLEREITQNLIGWLADRGIEVCLKNTAALMASPAS